MFAGVLSTVVATATATATATTIATTIATAIGFSRLLNLSPIIQQGSVVSAKRKRMEGTHQMTL